MTQQPQSNTVIQFSIRSFFIMAVVLSAALSIAVPLIRSQPSAFGRNLMWGAVISMGLAVIGLLLLCLRRWWIERRGGTIRLRPQGLNPWLEFLPMIIMLVVFSSILVAAGVMLLPTMKEMSRQENDMRWTIFTIIASLSACTPAILAVVYSITLCWWRVSPMTLEIRENGIGIGGLRFFQWSVITGCQWSEGKHVAILSLWCHSRKYVALVPSDARESVQRLLEDSGIQVEGNLQNA
jgi:hypothetical protein